MYGGIPRVGRVGIYHRVYLSQHGREGIYTRMYPQHGREAYTTCIHPGYTTLCTP